MSKEQNDTAAPTTGEVVEKRADWEISPALRVFADMASTLPQADGDATERIVAQILATANFEDLDAPWRSTDTDRLIGVALEITGAKVSRSDFAEGLGVFLVVEATVLATGEAIVFTTGSTAIVAQVVKAYCMGRIPFVAQIVQSERPTKDGYRPQHLELVKATAAKAPF